MLAKIKAIAARLKREVLALYLVGRDPRTPRYAKVVIGLVLAYALSPIDLVPDFIPVLGYVDDLVFAALGYLAGNPPDATRDFPSCAREGRAGRAAITMGLARDHGDCLIMGRCCDSNGSGVQVEVARDRGIKYRVALR